ncbi:hypothetical protein [Christiangramia echinicola]|uniref:hypothetical protein n=1 Tax=Christiangramia echinicola TaxID=279359 RepID=UPI001FCC65FA|nr:hypothetical protein [Christiangramia echinicola]
MTILAENRIMQVAFNKILKEDSTVVLPFLNKTISATTIRRDIEGKIAGNV